MQTPLFHKHVASGAKMVDFCGWQMPVQYAGVVQEHGAVRKNMGLFDVSHMGVICLTGEGAGAFLDYIGTNRISNKSIGQATYTVLTSELGGCVDDAIVYSEGQDRYLMVVNGANRKKDWDHLCHHAQGRSIALTSLYDEVGIIAIQGPQALPFMSALFPELKGVPAMCLTQAVFHGEQIRIASTGYTGSGGYECIVPNDLLTSFWDHLMQQGASLNLQPVGLAARDTLRLEMGYALYGHELSERIAPTESVSSWTVKWDKGDFLGKSALEQLSASGKKRQVWGLRLLERAVPREGYAVLAGDRQVGEVTSGTFSPSLQRGIALSLVGADASDREPIWIQIRERQVAAERVPLPFYRR